MFNDYNNNLDLSSNAILGFGRNIIKVSTKTNFYLMQRLFNLKDDIYFCLSDLKQKY